MRGTALLALAVFFLAPMSFAEDKVASKQPDQAKSVLDFKMKDIDGKEVDLSQYKGKVLLIVNVASKCGNTPQYKTLEALYRKHKDDGLVILGFPANDFRGQEPGSDQDIKAFCTEKYDVTFPMFSKISVKGDAKHPLYQFLTTKQSDPRLNGEIDWNFAKFLVNRDGQVVSRFTARTKPDAAEVTKAIEAELARK
jgi:glutathione peroxidase